MADRFAAGRFAVDRFVVDRCVAGRLRSIGSWSDRFGPIGSWSIGSRSIGSWPVGSWLIGPWSIGAWPVGSGSIGAWSIGSGSIGSRSLWLVSLAFRRFLLGSALLAIEPLLATSLVALALLLLKRLPWIPMHSAGSPVASAGFSGFLKGAFRLLGRRPQLSARNHFISASGCRSCSRCNVGISSSRSAARNAVGSPPARIVQYAKRGGIGHCCPSRFSFSTSVVRLMRSSSAALFRLPLVRSSAR